MRIRALAVIGLLALPQAAFAVSSATVSVEMAFGLEVSPVIVSDSFDSAAGVKWEAAIRYQPGRFGYFLIGQGDHYAQTSRHAEVSIDTQAIGPGVVFRATDRFALYAHGLIGRGKYHLSEDTGLSVARGKKTFTKITLGGRWYFDFGDHFSLFAGPEISHSTLEYAYPASYGGDTSEPTHFNVGGSAGFAVNF